MRTIFAWVQSPCHDRIYFNLSEFRNAVIEQCVARKGIKVFRATWNSPSLGSEAWGTAGKPQKYSR
jgi:hypothetical protein